MSRQLYHSISKLYTMEGGVRKKDSLNNAAIIENAYILVEDGKIIEIGKNKPIGSFDTEITLGNRIVIPGLIDCHTHLVYAGNRSNEYAMKLSGKGYLDILNAGGGILSTVRATRNASKEELYNKAARTIHYMQSRGVTTIEAKSGYGLNLENELKQLEVVQELQRRESINLVSTFMPAHAVEAGKDRNEYIDEIANDMLPIVSDRQLATFMDVFLEKDVFSAEEAKTILLKGKEYGLLPKAHIDEIERIGGVQTALDVNAVSVEHCMVTSSEDATKLADNGTVLVLLPSTSFNLQKPYADIQMLLSSGSTIAIATDYNPGSCPCDDLLFTMRLASREGKLLPNEVLAMCTINAAKALNLEKVVGSLEVGKQADFVVYDANSFDEIIAGLDNPAIYGVYWKGYKIC